MKILFTNFHHRNGGGHVTYIINLLKGLSPNDELSVATPGTSRLFRQASDLGNVKLHDMRFTSRLIPMIKEVLHLRRLIQKERFDVIHVNASADHRHVMLAVAGLRRRPVIVWTKHNDHKISSVGHKIRAKFGTDAVIAVSSYVGDMVKHSAYRGLPLQVIRHGIDTDYFKPPEPAEKTALRRELFGSDESDFLVFGSSGGTDLEKGWLDLVRAVATLPEPMRASIRIVVAGDPPKAAYLEEVAQLGLTQNVVFPGLVDDVRAVLGACDVGFVLSYREALSFACRETLSMGLPTMVSDAGGLPENIDEDKSGWVVPAADVANIAACVRSICQDQARLVSMGAKARSLSLTNFALSRFCTQTRAVYSSCLNA
ncbi:glycosyltransferase [Pusillimonas minor]|uniref:Glycosyltransferase n=1 Tax=Pusillimonas minor TaxID=2697024 RepID=A0A842HVQ7_9BURK|nr:glycosyltransferase [Pusillimonas minor]MBC2770855.1 glycosyltransferase [Pusillimonas minor]